MDVLKRYLPTSEEESLLELAAGTGQHTAHFASHFTEMKFTPTEYSGHPSPFKPAQSVDDMLTSISAYTAHLSNVAEPVFLDAAADKWSVERDDRRPKFTAVLAVNVCHISPIEVTRGIFRCVSPN